MADAAQAQAATNNTGPPFLPAVWQYGGQPKIVPDVIICAIYLFLYVLAAVIHKVIFLTNKKKGQKFVMSAMTFGFCFVRLITFSTRLAWGVRPANASLALVSNIFLNAGIPILYIINLVFVHRITRAQHPRLGWHRSLSILGWSVIGIIVATLIMLIYAGVQSAYTKDAALHQKMRDIQIYGSTMNTFIAIIPLPMLLISYLIPKRIPTEKFGTGRFRMKVAVLITSCLLLTLRAVWNTTTTWLTPVPLIQPMPWYFQKAIFYTVQLLTELIVVYMFIVFRINRIFYTPDNVPRGSYADLPKFSSSSNTSNVNQAVPPSYAAHDFPTVTTLPYDDRSSLGGPPSNVHYSSTSLLLDNASGRWKLNRHGSAMGGDVYSPSYTSSECPSARASMGTQYYSHNPSSPLMEQSANGRVSPYKTSTWSHRKDRDSLKSGHSTPASSHRWSGPGMQRDMELQQRYEPIAEVREAHSRQPYQHAHANRSASFQDRVERVMHDSAQPARQARGVRIASAPAPSPSHQYSGGRGMRSPLATEAFEHLVFTREH